MPRNRFHGSIDSLVDVRLPPRPWGTGFLVVEPFGRPTRLKFVCIREKASLRTRLDLSRSAAGEHGGLLRMPQVDVGDDADALEPDRKSEA